MLYETHPEFEKLWSKSNSKSFCEAPESSRTEYIWVCPATGEEYVRSVDTQISCKGVSPFESNRKIHKGFNDIFAVCPDIEDMWDFEKNTLSPYKLGAVSTKKAWWLCPETGYSYSRKISEQVKAGRTSPVMSGRIVVEGYNDLQSKHPEVLEFWDDELNVIKPSEVTPSSSKSVWWHYSDGCSYQKQVRYALKTNMSTLRCPEHEFKKNRKVEEKDHKATLFEYAPEVAALWSPNNDDTPHDVLPHSKKRRLWICPKYGVEYERSVKNQVKAGATSPYQSGHRRLPYINDLFGLHPELKECWDFEKNDADPLTLGVGSDYLAWWICPDTKRSFQRMVYVAVEHGATYKKGRKSSGEKELAAFLTELNVDFISGDRELISPLEVDFYIPGKNLAIEFNGIYWHDIDHVKDKNYHYAKWKKCQDRGVNLIQIWEDEWLNRKSIVKKMLEHKLGVYHDERVYARKTSKVEIDYETSRKFCDLNHIQGSSKGTFHLGLEYLGELVAVSVWTQRGDELILDRYCTSKSVVGGLGKLIKMAKEKADSDTKQISTFSDNCVSTGDIYNKLGFTPVKEISPDYKYVVGDERIHKFSFRKKRFRNDPSLQFEEGMTEFELALLNRIPRIYDAGKVKWTIPF